ncbi:hypothetical protein ACFOOM_12040 [Streptomyces echinoruber]|uniref:Uncharacterized protein n=1 Tax=Streptomyces echinoruber TaxID=68898 RepID=A0A918RN40_9ACTN|nr:hypothetical protein [Streptomyces echinoruber]GHA01607.1 hypothetical protein GCM10010389_46240 [Streptomyces echinoruber]
MPQPTIGRIVHYRLTEHDASDINRRREDWQRMGGEHNQAGIVGHVGNHVSEGDLFPAVIVRVWNESTVTCNLQVLLDGIDTYWATSRAEGTESGTWAWPERA